MKRLCAAAVLALAFAWLCACDRRAADGPPRVVLGDSVCEQCNMIISDERWVTATIVEGRRGPEPRVFDDFNCQVNHETAHPEMKVLARWSRSFGTREWIPTDSAHFLMSPNLRSPMGSRAAAFASSAEAEAARSRLSGDLMTFGVAWKRLALAGACCHVSEPATAEQEHADGP